MGLIGGAVLVVWHDVAPGGEAEFDHWHIREHIPERLGVPGFLRFRRYRVLRGPAAYFYFYETESIATLSSPAYLARLNDPTPWTRRVLPLFRHTKRTACRVTATLGQGVGGTIAPLDVGAQPGREEELRAWLTATALPGLMDRPALTGAHLCEADVEATQVKTEEKKVRERPDALARWVILVEGTDAGAVEAACREVLNADALARRGAAPDTSMGLYQLHYCQSR